MNDKMNDNMSDYKRMLSQKLFDPQKTKDASWPENRRILEKFNVMPNDQHQEAMALLRQTLGHLPEDAVIRPPFHAGKGKHTFIGENFYANLGLMILDSAKVTIGNNVLIGPRVSIYTENHPIDATILRQGYELAQPVTIEDDVWLGGNVIVNPGVTIGEGSVIGSGSVVVKDIPAHSIAVGNPCKVIRKVTSQDKSYWERLVEDYHDEMGND